MFTFLANEEGEQLQEAEEAAEGEPAAVNKEKKRKRVSTEYFVKHCDVIIYF